MLRRMFFTFLLVAFALGEHSACGMNGGWTKFYQEINFESIPTPQISPTLPAIRLVRHASTGAIRGNGLSYVSSKNYVAKASGAFVDIPSVCCRTVISGARDVTYNLNDVRALSASERGPRLHSEIAFLQDLTGVCDPARQNPTTDSILVNILRDIQSSLSEGNENFNLEILIKNSRNNPCTSTEFIGDLGMDCQSYLRLFCEKVNNYDLFQQVTRCVCKIYVQAPSGVTCIQ